MTDHHDHLSDTSVAGNEWFSDDESNHEHEEGFPTRPIEQQGFAANKFGVFKTDVSPGGYDVHEGLIAYVSPDNPSMVYLAADSDNMRTQLGSQGYELTGGGVPLTGADSSERYGQGKGALYEQYITYNLAAAEKGLRTIDWEQLSDDQKSELERIGFSGSNSGPGQLLSYEAAITVQEGYGGLSIDDLHERAEQVGTWSAVKISPDTNPKASAEFVALTDANGNQMLSPKTQALVDLLDQLGYTEQDEPTFDTNALTKSEAHHKRAVMDRALYASGSGDERFATTWNNNRAA